MWVSGDLVFALWSIYTDHLVWLSRRLELKILSSGSQANFFCSNARSLSVKISDAFNTTCILRGILWWWLNLEITATINDSHLVDNAWRTIHWKFPEILLIHFYTRKNIHSMNALQIISEVRSKSWQKKTWTTDSIWFFERCLRIINTIAISNPIAR